MAMRECREFIRLLDTSARRGMIKQWDRGERTDIKKKKREKEREREKERKRERKKRRIRDEPS